MCAVRCALCAVCCALYVVRCVLCAVCCTLCVVCCVLCAMRVLIQVLHSPSSSRYHNANRMTVKRIRNYGDLFDPSTGSCTWRKTYTLLGSGWCRPTTGYASYGVRVSDMECAQRCTEAVSEAGEGMCRSFANSPAVGCSLYPSVADTSSGEPGVQCYNKNSHMVSPGE